MFESPLHEQKHKDEYPMILFWQEAVLTFRCNTARWLSQEEAKGLGASRCCDSGDHSETSVRYYYRAFGNVTVEDRTKTN